MNHHKKKGRLRRHGGPGAGARTPADSIRSDGAPPFQRVEIAVPNGAPSSWPPISVCMIAKNEADNLTACLQSLEDLASQVIVVDTGSTDGSAGIAESLGAEVHHFPWANDFAAARNESLGYARGAWVFWLDADDRLSPQTVARLKRAATLDTADAFMCLVSSETATGGVEVTEHIRLFRNGWGIRFSGPIHETVFPALLQKRLRLAFTDIAIAHLGYRSTGAVAEKSARNLRLIESALNSNPNNLDYIFYRGQTLANLDDLPGAQADMADFLSLTVPDPISDLKRFWAYCLLVTVNDRKPDRRATEEVVMKALAEYPDHPQFLASLASVQLASNRVVEATITLRKALLALDKPVRGLRPPEGPLLLGLAKCLHAQGRPEEALKVATQALAFAPRSQEACAALMRLHLEAGEILQAEAIVQEQLSETDTPEAWLLLAEIRNRQGRPEESATAIESAQSRGLPSGKGMEAMGRLKAAVALSVTRSQRTSEQGESELQLQGLSLLARNDHLGAAECFGEAVSVAPTNPDNYRYLALALNKLGRPEEALEAWQLALRWDGIRGTPAESPSPSPWRVREAADTGRLTKGTRKGLPEPERAHHEYQRS